MHCFCVDQANVDAQSIDINTLTLQLDTMQASLQAAQQRLQHEQYVRPCTRPSRGAWGAHSLWDALGNDAPNAGVAHLSEVLKGVQNTLSDVAAAMTPFP